MSLRIPADLRSWTIPLLLLVAVIVPALGVLWFMDQAMRNEQLAVRQKLSDVYRAELAEIRRLVLLDWEYRAARLNGRDPEAAPSRVFADLVREDFAQGVVVRESAERVYPAPARSIEIESTPAWRAAERQENHGRNAEAADLYARLARTAKDDNLAALALQAQARCLVRAERTAEALEVLIDDLGESRFASAVDRQGRRIAADARLRALQLLLPSDARFADVRDDLIRRLEDYEDASFPAAQRRFLMKELDHSFATLNAEELAERYLEAAPPVASAATLQASGLDGYLHLASSDGVVTAIFHAERPIRDLDALLTDRGLPDNVTVELLPPGAKPRDFFLVSMPVGGFLQDWSLTMHPQDQSLFTAAADQRINAYRLTALLMIAAVCVLVVLIARVVRRQMKLTQLKNDLLSTVSHELKTPLASMRLLVDTLLEEERLEEEKVREYLRLVAKENDRLSHLVDNFLTFSRMDRNRHQFDREQILPETVVEAAAASVTERFQAADCLFEVEIEEDLPALDADRGALETVLINLLDNAFKYSEDEKQIVLRAFQDGDDLCFTVADNGLGLSEHAAAKIFDRFYQVDQSLARTSEGCGLGLSIVRWIVRGHGGTVKVDSKLGEGSTFTVRLPVADESF